MYRQHVSSSNIRSVGYDPETKTLEIEFKKGGIWKYHGVTPDKHQALLKAKSIGSYFHNNIRSKHKATV